MVQGLETRGGRKRKESPPRGREEIFCRAAARERNAPPIPSDSQRAPPTRPTFAASLIKLRRAAAAAAAAVTYISRRGCECIVSVCRRGETIGDRVSPLPAGPGKSISWPGVSFPPPLSHRGRPASLVGFPSVWCGPLDAHSSLYLPCVSRRPRGKRRDRPRFNPRSFAPLTASLSFSRFDWSFLFLSLATREAAMRRRTPIHLPKNV